MSVRTIWTPDKVTAARNQVNALVAKGHLKKDAYAQVGKKFNISGDYMGQICSIGPERMRARNKKLYNAKRGITTATAPATPTAPTTMTVAEALQFYNFCRQLGINIA